MLEPARLTARGLVKELGRGSYYPLQNIVYAIEAYSSIDEVIYVGFDLPLSNPIWGQFQKYAARPGLYSSIQTTVEVRYNKNMDPNWRRFVVCKEMCHALESDNGTHSNTIRAIDRIMSRFSLYSANQPIGKSFPAFDAESLAEIAALELMCPLEVRREVADSKPHDELCDDFGIPRQYGPIAFSLKYMDIIEGL